MRLCNHSSAKSTANFFSSCYRGGSGANQFILTGRQGSWIRNAEELWGNPQTLARPKLFGHSQLVMISESSVLHAVLKVNPGEATRHHETYACRLTAVAKDWPVRFQNDDLLIKAIP